MPDQYEYDAALSFAGADREAARVIAAVGQANGLKIFIDEQHYWETWGKNLNEVLAEVYDTKARYCVILISKDYCDKNYTNHERRIALDRALESRTEYILPVLVDDSWIAGLPRATAYFDLRKNTSTDVAQALVQKIRGVETAVVVPDGVAAPKVLRVEASGPAEFVNVQVAAECKAWKQLDSGDLAFRGGTGWYEDPVFDVSVMNRSADPVLLTAVGIEIVQASFRRYVLLGGGGAEPLSLHRTYQLDLPDVWAALANKHREPGEKAYSKTAVELNALALCRLPDPILMDAHGAYRFGLHLFDYVNCCPTHVDLFFWCRTDRGQVRSQRAELRYTIGSQIPPVNRYLQLVAGEKQAGGNEMALAHRRPLLEEVT